MPAPIAGRSLAVVERAHRGALEKQFFDALYLAAELHRQLGGIDVLLRGQAVTYAVAADPPRPLRIGTRWVRTLSDPRAGLGTLIASGARVWAERSALAAYAPGGSPLIAGVRTVDGDEIAPRWLEYRTVFFL